jgi:dolichol kinase
MPEEFLSISGILKEEIFRKSIHSGSGIVFVLFILFPEKDILIIGLPFLLLIILCLEVLRFKGVVSVPFLRGRGEKKIGGHAFFILGVIYQNIACPVKCRLWRPLTGI